MSVQKYPGRVLSKTPPTITPPVDGEGGSAPGVWTLSEALENEKAGTWPKPPLPKELYAWGSGNYGMPGISSTISRSSPVQVGALLDWIEAETDGNGSAFAIKSDNTLWSWGNNGNGQLGLTSTTAKSSPTQVGALTNWAKTVPGYSTTIAITTGGALYSWGFNVNGELGLNLNVAGGLTQTSSPTQVGALTDWAQIACGGNFSAAVKTDGTLWTWGKNLSGRLGLGDAISRSSPVQVGALTAWAAVAGGNQLAAAIKTDGTLWAWGYNGHGALGQLDFVSRSSPVQIGADTDWEKVAVGSSFMGAIKTDGTLWTWGKGAYGTNGRNTVYNATIPLQVGALTTWSNISAGLSGQFMQAIKTDGTLWTWGRNHHGQLGDNTAINKSSPVQVGSVSTWKKVSAGFINSVGILASP